MKNLKRIKGIALFPILIVVYLLLLSLPSYATEHTSPEEAIGFYYQNEIPENQIKEGNFFDLFMKPAQKQTLITNITNESDHDMLINVSVNNAKTSASGVIEYGPSSLQNTASMPYKLTDIVKAPKQVKVPKGEKTQLKLEINMPKKLYDGVILGGVHLQEQQKVEKESETTGTASVKNTYGYVFSISLQESEKEVPTELSNNASYFESNQGYISFNNNSSKVVKDMTIEMLLTKKGSDKVLEEIKKETFKMAPHSTVDLPFTYEQYKTGKYQTKVKILVDEKEWLWEDEFKVKRKDKKKETFTFVTDEKKSFNWQTLVFVSLLFLVLTLGIYFLLQKSQKHSRKIKQKIKK